MSDERHDEIEQLQQWYREGKIDRRRLFQAGMALGLTTTAVGGVLSVASPASAQDSELKLVTISQEQVPTWTKNFNPLLPDNTSRWPTQSGIFEPLAIYNLITAELTPWLATEWAYSEDNLTLTYTLRDGVKWSDGEAFDSADVKFTFDLLKATPALAGTGQIQSALGNVTAIEAPDAATVVFTFAEVNTLQLFDVSEQSIVPEHIWSGVSDPVTFLNETPVATGPFTEIGTFEGQYWELHKNPNYWQEGKPYIDGFRFPAYPDNASANLATTSGENDWAANFIDQIDDTFVAKDPEHNHYWYPATGATTHLYMNTTMAPFDDVNVRKAISMALDRPQIVEIGMQNYTHPADSTGLSDAFTAWKDEAQTTGEWVTRNVDKANELLDAAGLVKDGDTRKLPDGTAMEYELNVVTGWSDWVACCQIMAQNLEEVGIKATVQAYDQTTWFDKVSQGDFTLTIGWADGGPTPRNFYNAIMSAATVRPVGEAFPQNWHRFAAPGAEELITALGQTADQAEQIAISKQLQALYNEHAPAAPMHPGPAWGQFNTTRFTDFPSEENPYSPLPTWEAPERLIVMTTIKPVDAA